MPVMRGSLNCTVIHKEDFSIVEVPFNNDTSCIELSCGLGVSGNIPETSFEVNARPASYCNLPSRLDEIAGVSYSLKLIYPTNDHPRRPDSTLRMSVAGVFARVFQQQSSAQVQKPRHYKQKQRDDLRMLSIH